MIRHQAEEGETGEAPGLSQTATRRRLAAPQAPPRPRPGARDRRWATCP
jgi:hypothetical protein